MTVGHDGCPLLRVYINIQAFIETDGLRQDGDSLDCAVALGRHRRIRAPLDLFRRCELDSSAAFAHQS